MKIAITSIVVFDVPDCEPLDDMAEKFRRANQAYIGRPMQTITGQVWTMLEIPVYQVERWPLAKGN